MSLDLLRSFVTRGADKAIMSPVHKGFNSEPKIAQNSIGIWIMVFVVSPVKEDICPFDV